MTAEHGFLGSNDGLHSPYTFVYANAVDRGTHTPSEGPKDPNTGLFYTLASFSEGILSWTSDTNAIYKLTNPGTGTWTEVGGAGGGAPDPHQASHIVGGSDTIDADQAEISYVPTNYTRDNTPPEVNTVSELTSHLKGIDDTLGALPLTLTVCQVGLSVNSATATTTTWVDIAFDQVFLDEADTTHNNLTGEITVNATGTYRVSYDVSWAQIAGNNRSTFAVRAVHNLSGGGYTSMPGSTRWAYSRQTANGFDSVSLTSRYLSLAAGDILKTQLSVPAGTGDATAVADRCLFTVERVR